MIFKKLIYFLSYLLLFTSCVAQTEKINGVSFVASREPINESHVAPVTKLNANYAAVMPFGFIRDLAHPTISFNKERQWFGETKLGAQQYIEELRQAQIKIMLKPQIWVSRGVFTGNIKMKNEADWKVLEASYSSFILLYAKLAQELEVEIFCVGTELEEFTINRPAYWEKLIAQVRKIYTGKLTYAANWDEFSRTSFWNTLDFVGIDAYFPVSEAQTPTTDECNQGWKIHIPLIEKISRRYHKPILFTEFGYRSIDYCGKEPWRSDRSLTTVNLQAQANATQALFETFWDKTWFAGGFVWKWHHNHENAGGNDNARFTPQNKPVEKIIETQYSL